MKVLFGEGTTWHVVRGVGTTFMAPHEVGSAVTLVTGDFPVNPQPPSSPEPLTAQAVSTTQIDLSWNVSQGATGYHVFIWTGSAWKQLADVKAPGTQLHVTSLTPDTTYYFYAEAYNTEGKSATKWISAKTLAGVAPTSPEPLVAKALSHTEVALSWKASVGAQGYYVYQWNGKGWQVLPNDNGSTSQAATTTSVTVHPLQPGTTYYFYVEAYNKFGRSATAWRSVTTLPVVAAAPASPGPVVVKVSQGSVQVSWTNNGDADRYHVYYYDGVTYQQILPADIPGTTSTLTLKLKTGKSKTYSFIVQAYNNFGDSTSKSGSITLPGSL
jgi:uncharacterized protein YccT (UPF0319 family)